MLFIPISYREIFISKLRLRLNMDDIIILYVIMIFAASAFTISFMRLWFVTNYDANLGNKVKGLGLDFARLRKELRSYYEQTSVESRPSANMNVDMPADVANMSLEDAVEMFGLDAKDLNNPIVRPIAEKILGTIKAKAANQKEDPHSKIEML